MIPLINPNWAKVLKTHQICIKVSVMTNTDSFLKSETLIVLEVHSEGLYILCHYFIIL